MIESQHLFAPNVAEDIAAQNRADDEDGWTYAVVHDPTERGWSYIQVFDANGSQIGLL